MASSSRKCSDEDLQKALADLHEVTARNPVPDEFKFLCPEQEEYYKMKEKNKENKDKKTKKKVKLLPEEVQMFLSLKCDDHEPESYAELEGKEEYKDLATLFRVSDVFLSHWNDNLRAGQEKIRHELQTKGYVTYEVTDNEDEDAAVQAAPQLPRGRRRHRPGVTKSAGGVVKKLN